MFSTVTGVCSFLSEIVKILLAWLLSWRFTLLSNFCPVPSRVDVPPNQVFADVFVRKMRGGSQSSLVGTSDCNFYVLKLANNPQGRNTLFNEAFGSILARSLGLPIPDWQPIQVSRDFIARNPGLRFEMPEGVCAPAPGLHFGSKFVIGSQDEEVFEIVPRSWMERVEKPHLFVGMLLVDIWTENVDHRQVLFIEHATKRSLEVVFLDNGHMFRGPHGNRKLRNPRSCVYYLREIYARALESDAETWLRSIEALSETILWAMIQRVPQEWRTRALERDAIALLMQNQKDLRRRTKEVLEQLFSCRENESLFVDKQNGTSTGM
jgi:hypothetical protein